MSDALERTVRQGMAGLLSSFVVQMCYTNRDRPSEVVESFSGILLRHEDRKLVVTAAHCVKSAEERQKVRGPFIIRSGLDMAQIFAHAQDPTLLRLEEARTHPQHPDVSWIEIHPDPSLIAQKNFLEPSRMGPALEGGGWLLNGYPSSGLRVSEPSREGRKISIEVRRDLTVLGVVPRSPSKELADPAEGGYLYFDYPDEGDPIFGRQERGYPDAPGMSGGALWWVGPQLKENALFPEGDWRLVGIQASWCRRPRYLKVVDVTQLLELLDSVP